MTEMTSRNCMGRKTTVRVGQTVELTGTLTHRATAWGGGNRLVVTGISVHMGEPIVEGIDDDGDQVWAYLIHIVRVI